MEIKWNKAKEVLPPTNQNVLVWNGRSMYISYVTIYSPEQRAEYAALAENSNYKVRESVREDWRNSPGSFKQFGESDSLNDPQVYWAELPKPPETKCTF